MDETVFLEEPGVRVSSTRIEIGGQTFATRNVGSVVAVKPSQGTLGLILVLCGGVALFPSIPIGLFLIAIGALQVVGANRRRELRLMAGGGSVVALRSNDPKRIERIRAAVATAISVR